MREGGDKPEYAFFNAFFVVPIKYNIIIYVGTWKMKRIW